MMDRTPQIIVTRAVNHPCACCMSERAFHITAANGGGTATGISLCRQCMQTVLWEMVKLEIAPDGGRGMQISESSPPNSGAATSHEFSQNQKSNVEIN